ncbi:fused endonuclease-methyltransferase [Brachyspira pilosicoli P43/6/78]|uniref:site-specific DNA-methyltransferase (adenine-specific) n=1 Tax=Brachyspira pilosicoli P43/6/78 TaxID=1042417 RepID=A0A3B6VHI2_BRAPL|nr:N-6 DNA methylase [Brachyspira pilosicoli]AGA65410.1 fused endonuclease-methyltransferase [Brachyspira pilosicoli P43/6/78]
MANYNSAKQKAYDVILHLVDNFQNGIKSKNETETRRYYIDKFFEALGWDVGNEKGKREVIHEDIVKVKGKTKFPDYGFYFKGKRVFFVEAKDTKVDIKNDSRPAFQLRSYAWSAKLGVSILTDFEEFAVYDCTVRPKENDRTEAARIKYFTYEDYLKEGVFDYIYDLFERDNVANGSLDAYSENLCNRKGSETVDVHFLSTLDELRTKLAVVISKLNREMSEKDINYAVQQIIDRIIFLRVAEDRNVENYGLLALANPKNKNEDDFKNYGFNGENSYYENLNYIFDRANEKYNSGLFDEDAIVRNLNIDDKTIKDIIDELYTPKNPYQFSVIPVEIIGNAYEQFLGKTISIDKNHKAVIELKPEVRKAGGVYYTPEYIVDYIVANTVGEAIKGKTPDEIVNIKILDPACGSGSFLLGAYKYLLNYHKEYFLKNKTKKYMGSRYEIIDESGNLALWVRKQILINNIFGVDIDSNAVEVAKLSLLLKSFEDSFNVNEYGQGSLLNEKILPSLDNNIKCGNSLIGNDFYESHLDLDDATLYKINCFDWEEEFKSIFKGGGFDVVIGNPPYVKIQTMMESSPLSVETLKQTYKSASSGNIDIYLCFVEKAFELLKPTGEMGYILPHKFFKVDMGENLREIISNKKALKKVVYFGENQIFDNATTYTCLLFLSNEEQDNFKLLRFDENVDVKEKLIDATFETFPISIITKDNWNFYSNNTLSIIEKLKNYKTVLKDISRKIFVGLQTSSDIIYVLHGGEENNGIVKTYSKSLDREIEIERGFIKPFLFGKDIKRYCTPINTKWVIFPYKLVSDSAVLYSQKEIKEQFPKAWEYLKENKKALENRENGKMRNEKFYAYIYPKNLNEFEHKKISFPDINMRMQAVIDDKNLYHTTTIYSIVFNEKAIYNINVYMGIFNSKLFTYYVKKTGTILRGNTTRFKPQYINDFPIPDIDKNTEENLIKLVDNIMELNKKLSSEKNPNSITMLNRQINAVDKQIDALVYKLYNLNDEEIKIIEGE